MADPRHPASSPYSSAAYRVPPSQAYPSQYSSAYPPPPPPGASSGAYPASYPYGSPPTAVHTSSHPSYAMPPPSRSQAYPSGQVPSGVPGHPTAYGSLSDGMDPVRHSYPQQSYSLAHGYGAHATYAYDDHALAQNGEQLSDQQYPASPQRPFACDMCPLSFSRQHDLKRHRETHSGEKPFVCNGGCGKTFTRKDALKRHQLVKRCGTEEGV